MLKAVGQWGGDLPERQQSPAYRPTARLPHRLTAPLPDRPLPDRPTAPAVHRFQLSGDGETGHTQSVHAIDLSIIAAYLLLMILVGWWVAQRAAKDSESYFLAEESADGRIARIDRATGLLAGANASAGDVVFEAFLPGTAPTESADTARTTAEGRRMLRMDDF